MYAYSAVPAKCLPEECPVGQWRVTVDGKWFTQESVVVSIASQEEIDALEPLAAAEAARQVVGKENVCLAGATGRNATAVNGVYEPTSEMSSGGVTVYCKVGYVDVWLEYCAGSGKWQVKRTANKGEDGGYAYCIVPAKCLPEECPVGQWQVADDDATVTQASITVSIVSKKELENLKALAVAEAARQVVGTKNIRLVGATGDNATAMNGVYEPTSEMSSGGVTVYRKVGDAEMWLEYYAGTGRWQVKPTAFRGLDGGFAYCAVPAKCLPEECPVGQWQVYADGELVPNASITVSRA